MWYMCTTCCCCCCCRHWCCCDTGRLSQPRTTDQHKDALPICVHSMLVCPLSSTAKTSCGCIVHRASCIVQSGPSCYNRASHDVRNWKTCTCCTRRDGVQPRDVYGQNPTTFLVFLACASEHIAAALASFFNSSKFGHFSKKKKRSTVVLLFYHMI